MKWLKTITKEKFISILSYINRLLFVLLKNRFYTIPYVLMVYSVYCYSYFGSRFLVDNYVILVLCDTTLFVISFVHYTKNMAKYNKTTYNAFLGTFYFLILEITEWKLNFTDEVYLNIYRFIIIWTIFKSIYDNLNEDFKRYFTKQR